MPERYQYPVDEGFSDRIHTPEGVRSLVVKSQLMELLREMEQTATMSAVRRQNWWH